MLHFPQVYLTRSSAESGRLIRVLSQLAASHLIHADSVTVVCAVNKG